MYFGVELNDFSPSCAAIDAEESENDSPLAIEWPTSDSGGEAVAEAALTQMYKAATCGDTGLQHNSLAEIDAYKSSSEPSVASTPCPASRGKRKGGQQHARPQYASIEEARLEAERAARMLIHVQTRCVVRRHLGFQ